METTQLFKTKWGWMGIAATPRGVARIVLPKTSRRSVEQELVESARIANGQVSTTSRAVPERNARAVATHARKQLVLFLTGEGQGLDFPLDLSGGSRFQRRVWLAARQIPYGRARSYQWVAKRVGGKHYARAVGLALGANPVPLVVPCHRVVAHDGSLGGFSGGLRTKRRLLELEGTLQYLQTTKGR